MDTPRTEYLESLGMGEVLINRVARIEAFYASVLPEPIEDLFVEDYLNPDGLRSYGSAWFFTQHFMGEARSWEATDNWDLLWFSRVRYWRIEKQNYDFDAEPSEASRFVMEFTTLLNTGSMTASRNNCSHLRDILLKYFIPNMGEEPFLPGLGGIGVVGSAEAGVMTIDPTAITRRKK